MKIVYDSQADAALVHLSDRFFPGQEVRSEICDIDLKNSAVILIFDEDDKLLRIELLGASRILPQDVLKKAEG